MRSAIFIIAAGLLMGALPMSAFESTLPQRAIFYNGEALRTAIADGISRAGGTLASADAETAEDRH